MGRATYIDFTLEEISDYRTKLDDVIYRAEQRYLEAVDRADTLKDLLEGTIEVGQNNRQACEEEQADCQSRKDDVQAKIAALEDGVRQLSVRIRDEERKASEAEAQYRNACARADSVRNRSANNEAEAAERDRALAAARRTQESHAAMCAGYRATIDKLRKAQSDIERQIFELRNIGSSLEQIGWHLAQEHDRIVSAVDTARWLLDDIKQYMERLKEAKEKKIDGDLAVCQNAVDRAALYANEAWSYLCALNDQGYTSYDRITVRNVGGLQADAHQLHGTLNESANHFQEIYRMCGHYREILQDRIMQATTDVLENLAEQQRLALQYMETKAGQLDEFCKSLTNYCGAALK